MNYSRIYDQLVLKAKTEVRSKGVVYYEKHHIVPECMNGSNDPCNLVLLTAREHYLAHWLLVKIYGGHKLVSAFNKMCRMSSNQQRRFTSFQYENAKKYFSKYHPAKDATVKLKISESLKEYYINNPKPLVREKRYCMCGCEKYFFCRPHETKKYYHCSHTPKTLESRKKQSTSLKSHISSLSKEEQIVRLNKSLFLCDHKKRGHNISKSKKGKATNQQKIMGERYAKMTNEKFETFLNEKKPQMKTRLTNLRNKYLDISNK